MENSVFGPILHLGILDYVKFGGKMSPLAFNNSGLNTFSVAIINHFVFTTQFGFCEYNE
jgi:hypothetical protein